MKGIIVSITLKYSELRDQLYELTKVNSLEFNIIMRVKYKMYCEYPLVCLMDDDDVSFLLLKLDLIDL